MNALDRAFLLGLGAGLIVLLAIGAISVPPLAAHGAFAEQWSAARPVLEGGSPYDAAAWPEATARLAGRATDSAVFIYPPYVALTLVPLAFLPLGAAATLWVLAGIALSAAAMRVLLARFPPPNEWLGALFGLSLLASGPALLAIAQGQWDPLLLGAAGLATVAAPRSGALTGLAAGVFLFKPQLAPLVLIAFARRTEGRGRAAYVAVLAGILALLAVTALAAPSWWSGWWIGLSRFGAEPPLRTTTLATTATALAGAAGPLIAAVVALAAIGVGLAFEWRADAQLAVWLATAVLVAPYIQAYDHLLLLAPLVLASGLAARRSRRVALAVTAIGVVTLGFGETAAASLTIARDQDLIGALVAVAIWGLVVAALWPARRLAATRP